MDKEGTKVVEKEQSEPEKKEAIHPWRWRALAVWIVLFTLVGIWAIHNGRSLSDSNKERIADIQVSRVKSCKRNYESIRQIFQPFFPPPAHRTPKQKADLKKFNELIDKRIKQCSIQTKPGR